MEKSQAGQRFQNYERLEIEGKAVWVPYPVRIPEFSFVGREGIIERALAAWTGFDSLVPLNFRLYGPPGTGKNAIVYELSRILNKDLYIINGHQELGPEDIACSATMTSKNTVEYVASPLFAAMLRGGICFFDEIGKAPQAALDPLASVLDDRRTLTSVLAGIHLKSDERFLFCAALNEIEEEGTGLPGFIDERTMPAIYVGYPPVQEMEEILNNRLGLMAGLWSKVFISEFKDKVLSPRTAVILLEYAYRLYKIKNGNSPILTEKEIKEYLCRAYRDIDARGKHEGEGLKDEQKEKKSDAINSAGFFVGGKDTIH